MGSGREGHSPQNNNVGVDSDMLMETRGEITFLSAK